MDKFMSEKFGTDNAACIQNSEKSLKYLEAIQEDTLERQFKHNEVVHDEGDDSEEEEPLPDMKEVDEFQEEETFEEQVDPRWNKAEYFLIDEDVDWESIESDPENLFTIGNSKVGQDTIIFNLQPARFCPSLEGGFCKIVKPIGGQYKIACYAYQDEVQYRRVLQGHLRQMRFWDTHTAEEIFEKLHEFYINNEGSEMVYPVKMDKKKPKEGEYGKPAVKGHERIYGKEKSAKLKYIRFNESGDLKDVADAEKMDEVARLAKEKLNLISYTYTARRDILKKHLFKNVHIQGSGFAAITGLNVPKKGKEGGVYVGKVFTALPSIYTRRNKLQKRKPGVLYYEDVMWSHTDENGVPVYQGGVKKNPHFNKWSDTNQKGWFACRGDCNDCYACKEEKVHHVAVRVHREYHKIASEWHDVEEAPDKYKVRQKFDPYEREALTGTPLAWSTEMEQEYEESEEILRQEDEFKKKSKEEQSIEITAKLRDIYGEMKKNINNKEKIEQLKKEVNKWQIKANDRDIDWKKIKKDYIK
jgi:hypothetical protein